MARPGRAALIAAAALLATLLWHAARDVGHPATELESAAQPPAAPRGGRGGQEAAETSIAARPPTEVTGSAPSRRGAERTGEGAARPSRSQRRLDRVRQIQAQRTGSGVGSPPGELPVDPAEAERLLQAERAAAEAAGSDWRVIERMVNGGAGAAEDAMR